MSRAALPLALLTAACASGAGGGSSSAAAEAGAAEHAGAVAEPTGHGVGDRAAAPPLYVSVLTTRQTRLDGTNPPVGVFRSPDGGETWEHLGWEQGKAFAAVALGDTLLVAQGNGVHRSTDGGRSWRIVTDWRVTEVQDVAPDRGAPGRLYAATPYGLFRTENRGGSWSPSSAGLATPDATFTSTVRADRARPGRVLIGTEAGLFLSDDGGARWRPLPVSEPVRAVRQSPHDASHWAAALQDRGLAVSADGGEGWEYASGLPEGTTLYEVEWDPFEPGVLWAGGWKTGVLRSADRGQTWQKLGEGLPASSIHGLAVVAPGVVLVGTMGEGVFRTADGGVSWEAVAPETFGGGQVWDVARAGEW